MSMIANEANPWHDGEVHYAIQMGLTPGDIFIYENDGALYFLLKDRKRVQEFIDKLRMAIYSLKSEIGGEIN